MSVYGVRQRWGVTHPLLGPAHPGRFLPLADYQGASSTLILGVSLDAPQEPPSA